MDKAAIKEILLRLQKEFVEYSEYYQNYSGDEFHEGMSHAFDEASDEVQKELDKL